jgi:SAM-dependent methyltransferase
MKYYSIIRGQEYDNLSKLNLDGKILDVGGSKKSGYHELVKGKNEFIVINLDPTCQPDHFVDIEKSFPFENSSFDHAICLNVLEHVYEFEVTFGEQVRCVRSGGKIIVATPFIHHVHASPDDFMRYTESSFRRMAKKFDCEIDTLVPIGDGFFSLIFQTIGGSIPTTVLQATVKEFCVGLDKILNKLSKSYRKLTSRIPLGYFVVFTKRTVG